ncbi:hypothetical protein MJN39_24680, partial [Salmonella enterica subsp. enterica serovar Kentucky]|nr:hypothetical protein [Salmonella enterica subsp. enterica serovar Kentucky]
TFRNAADLYLYPNTLVVVKASGKEVKEWLECSAGQFNQIDIHGGNEAKNRVKVIVLPDGGARALSGLAIFTMVNIARPDKFNAI